MIPQQAIHQGAAIAQIELVEVTRYAMAMIRYHETNGPRGEVAVDHDGNFVGFVAEVGQRRWAAFTRTMAPIGDTYPSRASAAAACCQACAGPPVPIEAFLAARGKGSAEPISLGRPELVQLAVERERLGPELTSSLIRWVGPKFPCQHCGHKGADVDARRGCEKAGAG